jgi:hypothetical protein
VFGTQLYDTVGSAYPATRRTEPRIAEGTWAALGDARTVLNVGAGPSDQHDEQWTSAGGALVTSVVSQSDRCTPLTLRS